MVLKAGPAAVMVVLAWGMLIAYVVFGFSLVGGDDDPKFGKYLIWIYLGVALVFTAGCVPAALVRVRSALHMAAHGISVVGTVTAVKMISGKLDMVKTQCSYLFEDQEYHATFKIQGPVAKQYKENSEIRLIVDPRKPSRCILESYIVPGEKDSLARDEGRS